MNHIEIAHKNNLANLSQIHYLKHLCTKNAKVSNFKIHPKDEGKGTKILVINGFMNENEEDISEWKESLKIIWRENPYYHLLWKSKTLSDFFLSKINPIEEKKITWLEGMRNAEETGEILGKILASYQKEIILCGHSLGARVIYFALKYLNEQNIKSTCIKEIHLLGGAVGSKTSDWRFIKNVTTAPIYNYYSMNDDVLKYAYKLGTALQSDPVGRNEIEIDNVININTTKRVGGHSDYKKNLALFYLENSNKKSNKKIKIDIEL